MRAGRHNASLNPRRLDFSPDARTLLVGCNGVALIAVDTGEIVAQFDTE